MTSQPERHGKRHEKRQPRVRTLWLSDIGTVSTNGLEAFGFAKNEPRLAQLGASMWAPREFSLRVKRPDKPHMQLTIGMVDGRYRCLGLAQLNNPTKGYVEGSDLRAHSLPDLIRDALSLVSYFDTPIETEDDRYFVRAVFLEACGARPGNYRSIEIGEIARLPAFVARVSAPEAYERHLERDLAATVETKQAGRRPAGTDEEFIAAWWDAYAAEQNIQKALSQRFHITEGGVRNRAVRLRSAGYDLPSHRGPRVS